MRIPEADSREYARDIAALPASRHGRKNHNAQINPAANNIVLSVNVSVRFMIQFTGPIIADTVKSRSFPAGNALSSAAMNLTPRLASCFCSSANSSA